MLDSVLDGAKLCIEEMQQLKHISAGQKSHLDIVANQAAQVRTVASNFARATDEQRKSAVIPRETSELNRDPS